MRIDKVAVFAAWFFGGAFVAAVLKATLGEDAVLVLAVVVACLALALGVADWRNRGSR